MSDETYKTTDEGSEAELRAELEKVKAKNKELLTEKQKAKQKAQEAQDAADEAAQQAAERGGDMDALKAAHARELQKLQSKLDAATTDLRTIRVDNEINTSYSKAGRPELAEQFVAWVKGKVDQDYTNGLATINGVPIAEFVGSYVDSELGAHFRRPADHSGADATGNIVKSSGGAKLTKRPTTPAEMDILDAMPDAERNAFCDSIGAADLKV